MVAVKILVVEDNEDINRILCRYLEREGYQVIRAFSGTEANLVLSIHTFDLILLDLMIPGMTGEELIPEIRKKMNTPIIVISAKSTLGDKVEALKNGADDYITKPFEREEVLARVSALLRRSSRVSSEKTPAKNLIWKRLIINTDAREVSIGGNPLSLTASEYDLLLKLVQNPDRVFTKEQLYQEVWKSGYYGEDNTINVHISNIRKKIRDYEEESYIRTVWGIGFKME